MALVETYDSGGDRRRQHPRQLWGRRGGTGIMMTYHSKSQIWGADETLEDAERQWKKGTKERKNAEGERGKETREDRELEGDS